MLVRSVGLMLLLALGCSDSRPVIPDASGPPRPDAPTGETCQDDTDPKTVDFFGEACQADPYPANTTCHEDHGWCIDSVCRPMCANVCPRCPGGEFKFAPAGACYCAPRM